MSVFAFGAALLLTPAPLVSADAMNGPQAHAEISQHSDDPARLINLGAACERAGQTEAARDLYLAAVASRNPMEVRMANGEWIDSRQAARKALRTLEQAKKLAVR